MKGMPFMVKKKKKRRLRKKRYMHFDIIVRLQNKDFVDIILGKFAK